MAKQEPGPFDGKAFAARLPTRPGIYLMRDGKGEPLYVGKAANLRKRDMAGVSIKLRIVARHRIRRRS